MTRRGKKRSERRRQAMHALKRGTHRSCTALGETGDGDDDDDEVE